MCSVRTGTVSSTKITITAHPYQTGQRLSIQGVTWTGGLGINGVYDLIGVIDSNNVSIPFVPSAGSYASGGMTGDNALHIPTLDGAGVWHRVLDPGNGRKLEWFGPPMDGVGDDAPAVRAAIASITSPAQGYAPEVLFPPSPPGVNAPHFLAC
jgi:hypothetical protein